MTEYMAETEPERRALRVFVKSKGAVEILVITTLLSFGIGLTITLIPIATADRYARIHYGYTGAHCSLFDRLDQPHACQSGSDEAQAASAWSNMVLSALLLICNPVVGSFSDSQGRRGMIQFSIILSILPAFAFVLLIYLPNMSPFWYFAANSLSGAINFISLVFSALADVIDKENRAAAYGIVFAGFYGGFALGPSFSVILDPICCAVVSVMLLVFAASVGMLYLPETLSEDLQRENQEAAMDETPVDDDRLHWIWHIATRPFRDISILNRNWCLRLLTAGSFFSAMVFAADSTLVLFYIENQLDLRTDDLAEMFIVLGVFGIVCQGGLLQPLKSLLGEKKLLMAAFVCGVCHNFVYGVAKTKYGIMVAFIISQLTKLNFPILSSLASEGASEHEQGRIQGALFAMNAIANALGPLSMDYIYHKTKDTSYGPGFMWIFAAGLYFIGLIFVTFIPVTDLTVTSLLDVDECFIYHHLEEESSSQEEVALLPSS